MSTINDRIELLISHFTRGNKRAFALKSGLAPTVLENIVGKRGGKPSFDVLEKIVCAFATIDANWLLKGSGQMERQKTENVIVEKVESVANSTELIDRIVNLSGENALLKQKIEELEKQKIYNEPPRYGAVAEPISELKKGIKDYNKPIPENQLVTHKK